MNAFEVTCPWLLDCCQSQHPCCHWRSRQLRTPLPLRQDCCPAKKSLPVASLLTKDKCSPINNAGGVLLYLASGARIACFLFSELAVSFIIPFPFLWFLCRSSLLSSWIPQTPPANLAGLHEVQLTLSLMAVSALQKLRDCLKN